MTYITLHWGRKALVGLESRGHSGHGRKGADVVCAGVSALLHALLLGLNDVARTEGVRSEVDPLGPVIRVFWPEEEAEALDLLTRTVALSLKKIESGYPGHVSVAEVQSL